MDDAGTLYGGTVDGAVLKWAGDTPEVLAQLDGRPLGLRWVGRELLVAVADVGLVGVSLAGEVRTITTEVDGQPLGFADDLDVAPDGTVYVSDASSRFGFHDWKLDIIENGANGRVVAVDPTTGEGRTVLAGLHFANGVAVSAKGDFLLVAETARYRVTRLWLTGLRAGESEPFIEGLPGFPDGVTRDGDHFWISLPSPRNAALDATAGAPWLRRVIVRLPAFLQPAPERITWVVEVNARGRPVRQVRDDSGRFGTVTNAVPLGPGLLALGSLSDPAIALLELP